MNTSTLVQKVWNFCHTLRDDGVGYGDYLEQLTYLLFLKLAHEYAQEPYNRDTHIPKGARVVTMLRSANRDEEVFPQGDQFILDRPNIAEHLAFGRGPHNCPGLHIGRMELKVALEELLAATPNGFEVAGEVTMSRWPEIGALSVPLRFL